MTEGRAESVVKNFENEFYSNINNQTLEELAIDYGITLSGRDSFAELMHNIDTDFVCELFQHEPFRDLPVLGVYEEEENIFFPLEFVDIGTCCECDEVYTIYAGILISSYKSLDFCCYAVSEHKIKPMQERRVRDVIKKV